MARFRKKEEKSGDYRGAVVSMGRTIVQCMRQNHTMDVHETYFDGDATDLAGEPPKARALAVFKVREGHRGRSDC